MIRGVSREVELKVNYLGQWRTPWWDEKDEKWIDKGPKVPAGFVAKTRINRHDFGVKYWKDRRVERSTRRRLHWRCLACEPDDWEPGPRNTRKRSNSASSARLKGRSRGGRPET